MEHFGIVKEIMKAFKLGDEGKLGSFFGREVKSMERDIEDHKQNLVQLNHRYNRETQRFDERIEDAKAELDSAYRNVLPGQVATNAMQDSFRDQYWIGVENALTKLENIKAEQETSESQYEYAVDATNDQIEQLQKHISRIKD